MSKPPLADSTGTLPGSAPPRLSRPPQQAFNAYLKRVYIWYTLGFLFFVGAVAVLERLRMPRVWIGYIFLLATVVMYAVIGVMSRTSDAAEYYVAGRRVPAVFNGMATGADWMSAASFIGLAGTLYLQGFSGLAFVLGWTGGYVLVALCLAPYLRKFGQYTIPDFLGARYGGQVARGVGAAIAVLCSFVYIVAQIYGVGVITARLTNLAYEVGVFVGLAGILVCSFLGGMRAVTWTQVAQYIILIIAYMIPVVWLSMKHTGNPVPQLAYGAVLEKVTERETALLNDPKEVEVRALFALRGTAAEEKLNGLPASFERGRGELQRALEAAKALGSPAEVIESAQKAVDTYPKDAKAAEQAWRKQAAVKSRSTAPAPHGEPYPGKDEEARNAARRNFLALVFCLMVGTAGLPHILMRYYTTPSVREARRSVFWSLFFIFLLYFTAPALAVLVKYDLYTLLVGSDFSKLPAWVNSWARVDPSLLSITDVNRDGIVQLAEIFIGPDIVMLATPEIAGLPYVISGLVAAGGLAAALSTADGLLLTISNALSHDVYHKMVNPNASTTLRIGVSKAVLLVVAMMAAYVAAQKPADILFLVSAAFSMAAAGFFPALVLGIFWKRATGLAAVAGMLAGLGTTFYYMATTHPWLRQLFGVRASIAECTWWDISPISAGVFGVPVGFAVIVLLSLVSRRPNRDTDQFVDQVRYPNLR
ncbi:MAG: cation acetate symporter [Burkholderiales bacterium]|nr:cation acetate symporter [Burkholderiales bacterium]